MSRLSNRYGVSARQPGRRRFFLPARQTGFRADLPYRVQVIPLLSPPQSRAGIPIFTGAATGSLDRTQFTTKPAKGQVIFYIERIIRASTTSKISRKFKTIS